MAAGTDGEEAYEEGNGNASELAVHAVCKGKGVKGGWSGGKGSSWSVQKYFNSGKSEKGASRAGQGQCSKTEARKGDKVKKTVAKVRPEFAGVVGKQDTLRQIASREVGTGV